MRGSERVICGARGLDGLGLYLGIARIGFRGHGTQVVLFRLGDREGVEEGVQTFPIERPAAVSPRGSVLRGRGPVCLTAHEPRSTVPPEEKVRLKYLCS